MTPHEPRTPNALPADKRKALRRALRIEWLTLVLRISVVAVLYLALGTAQALTAIWLKSLWALLPPLAFIVACRIERLRPTPRFPYGFYRAGTIAFLSGALALSAMGLYLLYVALRGLGELKHPALGALWSQPLLQWPGWPVLAALTYSMLVPVIAGRSRQRLAIDLHDKGLYADATMGRASWLAGGAAIVGVVGIGLGLWWADFIATLLIGADILRHGGRHLYTAVCDLIDEVPRELGSSRVDPLGGRIRDRLNSLAWISDARVRLREEGRRLTGIAFVCPQADTPALLTQLAEARADIQAMDWRLLDFELVPVTGARCADAIRTPR